MQHLPEQVEQEPVLDVAGQLFRQPTMVDGSLVVLTSVSNSRPERVWRRRSVFQPAATFDVRAVR